MSSWWQAFFDDAYLRIWEQVFPEETNAAQARAIWAMLDLEAGCRVLDAPCGWGRLSKPLAEMGAVVVGADQSEAMVRAAQDKRGALGEDRLRYVRHDLRERLEESGFDVALNVFTSFGYGTEEEDEAIFRTLREAVRPGGRVLVETNHRDLMCSYISRGTKASTRLPDGTLFIDEAEFDAIGGVAQLNWYWSGPGGKGEKHANWRCYTPTEIVRLMQRAGLHFVGAYQGFSKIPFRSVGQEAGGRLSVVGVREQGERG
ncbi:MAG: methyltransferase domain-containing protein [Acidobacteria bacterium]|nr:methyltransferase domain-containing protein [Acidobacteriota bacterium]